MRSNITRMITVCLCLVVVGFAKQKGQEPISVEPNTVIVKDNSYYDNLRDQLTNPNVDEPKVVAEKSNPDQAKIDFYNALNAQHGSSISNWTDADYTSELSAEKAAAWGTNVYVPAGRDSDHTFTSCSDSWGYEGSWAIYSYDLGWLTDQMPMSGNNTCDDVVLNVAPGWYSIDSWDSYGDGGQDIYVDGAYLGSSSGTYSYIDFELSDPASTCSDITLVVGGGSYDGEISWDLSDGSSGGAGTFDLCLDDGDFTFNGYDSWGDGWNGGSFTFSDENGAFATGAVEGSSGSWTITVGGAPPVGGCTDAGAPNYNPDAEVDDGSCEFYCSASQWMCASGDQCIPASYMCDGSSGWGNGSWGPDCSDGSDEALETCCDIGDATYPSDCAGTCLGSATEDCAGTCGGSAAVDECGECGGDGSSCACDGEYLTVNMVDSWGDGWDGASFCINAECTTIDGASGSYTFCVDLSLANDVTCGGGSYPGEHSWDLVDEAGNIILSGGDPYAGCLGDCGVGGCMDANSDNYNSDATYDDGSCSAYIGMDCAYFGQSGIVDCDLYYCVPTSWLGDGGCDASYFACAELSCDGGDCEDCAGDCLGSAADDACGTCNGDCTESGGGCSDTDNGATDSYGDGCDGYTSYPSWCGGYDDDDFNSGDMCCACGGGDATSGTISCGDGSCDCDGNVADCNGDCGGSATNDECGVCGGDSSSCEDCCGVPNGDDSSCDGECGACGASIPEGNCDCDGNVADCNGDCGGDAAEDNCGVCDSDSSNDCPQDCNGVFGGDAFLDCDGYCTAGGYSSWVGDGYCDSGWINLACAEFSCDGGDCDGACGCNDDTSCADECGVPNGDGSSCADCAGTPNGDAELDYCGVCEGGNVADDCDDGGGSGCEYTDATLTMNDSFGDGWNGNTWSYTNCGDGSTQTATIEDGADGTADFCINMDCANFYVFGGGSWISETSWSLESADGIIASGGGADSCGCIGDCDPDDCGGDGEECVNDDSTGDSWGLTCSQNASYYGDVCYGGYYDDDDFDECSQCCACEGNAACGARDADTAEFHAYTQHAVDVKAHAVEQQFRLDNPIATSDGSRDDCGGTGPDVGCDGVCFSGLVDDECGECDGGGIDEGACDCAGNVNDACGTCGGSGIADCSDDDCGNVGGWVGDGLCDGASQTYGYDLSCYDCDGGDCVDECGVCEGDSSSCADCCDVPNGDNSSCGNDGDVNFDGSLDVLDITQIVSLILGFSEADECQVNAADIEIDGSLNVLDVISAVDMILAGYSYGCTDAGAPEYDADANADDGSCWTTCAGNLGWIGDGYCDGSNNNAECAYDGGDCCESTCVDGPTYSCDSWGGCNSDCLDPNGSNDDCAPPTCATSDCGNWLGFGYTCEELLGYGYDCSLCEEEGECAATGFTCTDGSVVETPEDCEACAYDYSAYGAPNCDAAFDSFGYDCATLEAGFNWDCTGCTCPGDTDDGGDDVSNCPDGTVETPGSCSCHADCADDEYCYGVAGSYGYCWATADCCSYDDAIDGECPGGCDDGGGDPVCGEECAAGTYYDGWSCYTCDYCVNQNDDSACDAESGNDCCGACGGSASGDCGGRADITKPYVYVKHTLDEAVKMMSKKMAKPEGSNSPLGRSTKALPKFESKLQRAGSVKLIQTAEGLSYEADGFVGFEITLEHGADFKINVTESGFIANYHTVGNTTKVVVVNNETSELFSSTGDFEIVDVMAGTTGGTVLAVDIVSMPTVFGLSGAYPNPFNPSTSFELAMPQDGFVSVKVYNLMGQLVTTLQEGNLTANDYSFTWDAADVASGMYFLKAETAGNVDIQKIMFMK